MLVHGVYLQLQAPADNDNLFTEYCDIHVETYLTSMVHVMEVIMQLQTIVA